jgi:DNA-binding CsgD family transcriptional regulator
MQGDISGAKVTADQALQCSAELGEFYDQVCYGAIAVAALAAGDVHAAWEAGQAAERRSAWQPMTTGIHVGWSALAALGCGDSTAARRLADEAVSMAEGMYLSLALAARARVEFAYGESEPAERDARDALGIAAGVRAHLLVPDILELLARLVGDAGGHHEAARFLGAADSVRRQMDALRFKVLDADHAACVTALRDALDEQGFDDAWAEGAALTTEEAIAYAQRGRGERKRPATGWASLTPTERDVVGLVGEGLANKDVAARLFVSPRTVESHLTHVYSKLGLSSRVQLAQEAARRARVD